MGLMSHLYYVYDPFILLSRFSFFDEKSDNDGPGSGSSGTCPFPFSSVNSVGRVSGSGSEMMKCSFPFFDGEIVNCSFPFLTVKR